MPLLWRYLLRNFFQVFILSVFGFVAVLLVTRFQSIARFASTGASPSIVCKFVLMQIPHILPLTIPISALIASFILYQRLSYSHEMTALRVAGLGPAAISFPLILSGVFLALLNFTIVSEISPRCRGYSKNLAHQMTLINPLSLLQKGTLIKFKDVYIDMKVLQSGEYAEDVCLVMRNPSYDRLWLIVAKKLSLKEGQLIGEGLSFISSFDSKKNNSFDHLIIENQSEMYTEANFFPQHLIENKWSLGYESLNLRLIQAKHAVEEKSLSTPPIRGAQEIARRISLFLAPLVFIFVGMACGLEIERDQRLRSTLTATALMTLYLVAFVVAKSLRYHLTLSLSSFSLPFLILGLFCYLRLKKFSKGGG